MRITCTLSLILGSFTIAATVPHAQAAAVVVEKHENLLHSTVGEPVTESYSPFFTHHINGTPFSPANGWAPTTTVRAADPATAASTTPKKSFSFIGDSTAAGNWTDGNGIPAGITLTFDAEFTVSPIRTTEPSLMLTVPGSLDDVGGPGGVPPSTTRFSGRGFGLTVVPGGADDINNGRGLIFTPVTVSNISFSGTLADTNFSFTSGSVFNFGVQLFESGQLNETTTAMRLIQGEDNIVDLGEETIGWGNSTEFGTGTLASHLRMETNFGIYHPTAATPPLSGDFPRQSGPFTISTTGGSAATFRGLTLGYDVTYDISPAGAAEDADFDGDGDVDGADFLTWQRGVGVGTDLTTGDANDDNVVDGDDLAIWSDQFGAPPSIAAVAQIPEPAGAAILVIGSIAMLATLRRRS